MYRRVLEGEYPGALCEQLTQDALYVWQLGPILLRHVFADETLLQPYWELEILLMPVLSEMECRGIGLDRARIARALEVLQKQMITLYGEPFNPRLQHEVRGFLNRTYGLRLINNDRIDDNLLKGLARSYAPAFKLRTWRRLSQMHGFLETLRDKIAAIRDGGLLAPL